jgi:hypothetical protein
MQKKLFLTDSTGYEIQTFLTPIKQHTLVKNMFLHKNPDSYYEHVNTKPIDHFKMY